MITASNWRLLLHLFYSFAFLPLSFPFLIQSIIVIRFFLMLPLSFFLLLYSLKLNSHLGAHSNQICYISRIFPHLLLHYFVQSMTLIKCINLTLFAVNLLLLILIVYHDLLNFSLIYLGNTGIFIELIVLLQNCYSTDLLML
jgi:hypothetical protein